MACSCETIPRLLASAAFVAALLAPGALYGEPHATPPSDEAQAKRVSLSIGLATGLRTRTFGRVPLEDPDEGETSAEGFSVGAFADYRVGERLGVRARATLSDTENSRELCAGCATDDTDIREAQLELLLTVAPVGTLGNRNVTPLLYGGTSYSRFWIEWNGDYVEKLGVPAMTLGGCVEVQVGPGKALLDLSYAVVSGSRVITVRSSRARTVLLGYAVAL